MKANKIQYIVPECEEIRILFEGCLAASPGSEEGLNPNYDGFNNEQLW